MFPDHISFELCRCFNLESFLVSLFLFVKPIPSQTQYSLEFDKPGRKHRPETATEVYRNRTVLYQCFQVEKTVREVTSPATAKSTSRAPGENHVKSSSSRIQCNSGIDSSPPLIWAALAQSPTHERVPIGHYSWVCCVTVCLL